MLGATKIRIDQNPADNFTKAKKCGVTISTENTKRAALGELQNRAVLRLATAKESVQNTINDAKLRNVFQSAKPRVDTHWKKAPVGNGASNKPNAVSVAVDQSRKVLTRSSSLRLNSNNGVNGGSTALRHAANIGLAGVNKPKTITTKIVENKLQHSKVISKSKVILEEKTKKPVAAGEKLILRREDSNLSLKTLTKLKAALSRDGSKVPLTKSSSSSQSVKPEEKAVTVEPKITADTEKSKCTYGTPDKKTVNLQIGPSKAFEDGVEDIDSGDADKLLLASEYVNDIYNYLFQLETEQFIRENHLADQEVYPKMRSVLIDWINEVHFQFHLVPETFQMAVAIIDRYLQEVKDTKRSQLQLVGVTALFIAAKYEELFPPSISDFVYITDDTYDSKQIVQMELKIFKTLDCNLARPLPIHFLRRFSKAAKAEDIHHAMGKYFLELTSIEYDLAAFKPSEIAAASLFLALCLLNDNAKMPTGLNHKHWTSTLEWYSRYTADHLHPIAEKIASIVRNASTAKLRAVYNKYQSSKFHKIALRPELYGTLIDSIINRKEKEQNLLPELRCS